MAQQTSLLDTPDKSTDKQRLGGEIERILFHKQEDGFSILAVRSGKESVTIKGNLLGPKVEESIEAVGHWVSDPKWGMQFQAELIQVVRPTTEKGITNYLASGMIPGVGPSLANVLVNAFGEKTFQVIEEEPERLLKLKGIGKKKLEKIVKSFAEQKAVRDIMAFLQSYDLSTSKAFQIYRKYGNEAIAKISRNPYRLVYDIKGIGFTIADTLAINLGLDRQSPVRAKAGVVHVMQERSSRGHCAIDFESLVKEAIKLLDIPEKTVAEAIHSAIEAQHLVHDSAHGYLFLPQIYHAEKGIVKHLARIQAAEPSCRVQNAATSLQRAEKTVGLPLDEGQREAAQTVLSNKITVITGGPGTGKTTVLKTILEAISEVDPELKLCAPTGRAAKRMSEATGEEAATVHRTLEFDPMEWDFVRNEEFPLDADIIFTDEFSMMDAPLSHSLLRAIPDHASLVIVGDIDQLPSVGPGNVLRDIIRSQTIPTQRLTKIHRQSESSWISVNAHRANQGERPVIPGKGEKSDFFFVRNNDPERSLESIKAMITTNIPKHFGLDPMKDIQILTPMHKGEVGTITLNKELQTILNPQGKGAPTIKRNGNIFAVGDKVMQTVNDRKKEIYNGEVGFIEKIDLTEGETIINFDGQRVIYELTDLDNITLAYATTIHKSQGSEYPAVIIPLTTKHFPMLERNLLYTGITRGKQLVVLVGEERALDIALKTVRSHSRTTLLAERLRVALEEMPDPDDQNSQTLKM